MMGADEELCKLVPALGRVEGFVGLVVCVGGVGEEGGSLFDLGEVGFVVWGEVFFRIGDCFDEVTSADKFDVLLKPEVKFQGALFHEKHNGVSFWWGFGSEQPT